MNFPKEKLRKFPKDKLGFPEDSWLLDITEETKKYFGDYVKKVEIGIAVGGPRSYAELDSLVALDEIAMYKNDDELDLENMNLYITFPDGKMISIWGNGDGNIKLIK